MNTIRTFTGRLVDLKHPDTALINAEDIAHSLSMQCRFGGHVRDFYSVAEHSVHVMEVSAHVTFPPQPTMTLLKYGNVSFSDRSLAFLMHDAAEAYLGDVVTPLKEMMPDYRVLEKLWESEISTAFGLALGWDNLIKLADQHMLGVEAEQLGLFKHPINYALHQPRLQCWSPAQARREFLFHFCRLRAERDQAAGSLGETS